MLAPVQVGTPEPTTLAVGLVVAVVVLLGLVVLLRRRAGGTEATNASEATPLAADAPRGRICPECSAVNEMDATECSSCGRPFGDPGASDD